MKLGRISGMNENYCFGCLCESVEEQEKAEEEEFDTYLLVGELLSQIQSLCKEIVVLREQLNFLLPHGERRRPYPFPGCDMPYSMKYYSMPAMRKYEELFGTYEPYY
jgi:hypothetical protein